MGLRRILSSSRDIYNCIFSSLKLCGDKKFTSIAFPQMGSREGYSIYDEKPNKKMIVATYLAINDYLALSNSNIKEIYIHPTDLESEELFLLLFDNDFQLRKLYMD